MKAALERVAKRSVRKAEPRPLVSGKPAQQVAMPPTTERDGDGVQRSKEMVPLEWMKPEDLAYAAARRKARESSAAPAEPPREELASRRATGTDGADALGPRRRR